MWIDGVSFYTQERILNEYMCLEMEVNYEVAVFVFREGKVLIFLGRRNLI
jgi:deoxyinosine 3'endonuclease (endonuclease V)